MRTAGASDVAAIARTPSLNIVEFRSNGRVTRFDVDNGRVLDAFGALSAHSVPDSVVRRVKTNEDSRKKVAAILDKLAHDAGYQRRIARLHTSKNGAGSRIGGPLPRGLLVSCDPLDPYYEECLAGDPGGGGGSADLCTIKALAIYAETQEWEEANNALNEAWTAEGIDAASFAQDVASGDEFNAAIDAANMLKDDYAIARAQIDVDNLADDLNAAANDYWASGCT